VTPGDAQDAFEMFLGIQTPDFCQETTSDGNCNENTTPGDAQDIFEHFLGILTLPPCCAEYTGSATALSWNPFKNDEDVYHKQRIFPLTAVGYPGEVVKVPIVLTSPAGVRSFSFEMNYPIDLLEFLGVKKTLLTHYFELLIGVEDIEGVVRIEGEGVEPIEEQSFGSLVVAVFRVKEGLEASLPIIVFNPDRDIFDAEPGEAMFVRSDFLDDEPRFIKLAQARNMPDGTFRVPIRVSSAFNIKSFGLKLQYSEEKMSFIGIKSRSLTKDFVALDGNEIKPGKVKIGGFGLSGIREKRRGILVDLIFSVHEKGGEIAIERLFDDLRKYTIRKAKIRIK
jgi:hypothetical protein